MVVALLVGSYSRSTVDCEIWRKSENLQRKAGITKEKLCSKWEFDKKARMPYLGAKSYSGSLGKPCDKGPSVSLKDGSMHTIPITLSKPRYATSSIFLNLLSWLKTHLPGYITAHILYCHARQEGLIFTLQIWLIGFHKWKLDTKCITGLYGIYSSFLLNVLILLSIKEYQTRSLCMKQEDPWKQILEFSAVLHPSL